MNKKELEDFEKRYARTPFTSWTLLKLWYKICKSERIVNDVLQYHIALIKGNDKEYANLIKDTIKYVEENACGNELKLRKEK